MDLERSILKDIRESVGLSKDSPDFDTELLMHINSAIVKLHQNDIVKQTMVKDDSTTWGDLMDSNKNNGNEYYQMVPLYVAMSTKIIFDPPPPSAVEYHSTNINQLLWRLKIAYEDLTTPYDL